MKTLNKPEQLGTHLSDLNALLSHFTVVVDDQINKSVKDGKSTGLELHRRLLTMLTSQKQQVEAQCELHASDFKTASKEAVTNFLGFAAGVYNHMRDYPESRALRDNYTALTLLAASLTSLKTYGLMVGNEVVSKMAYDHLKEVCPLIVEISQRMPEVVARETAERESLPYDPAVAERVSAAVKRCWT